MQKWVALSSVLFVTSGHIIICNQRKSDQNRYGKDMNKS